MKPSWMNRKDSFKVVDVRKVFGNFLPGFLKAVEKLKMGDGVCVIQSFEPIPLYSAMADLGFEHFTEKVSDDEYRAYFYRRELKSPSFEGAGDMPLKPVAIVNFKRIDNVLANIAVNFWDLTWNRKNSAIDLKTKLLLSLSNAVGAGRIRQATRELIKAYAVGATTDELGELFSLFVWNGGIGTFASEIGPSSLFAAYKRIRVLEAKGKPHNEIVSVLMAEFGENNPKVSVSLK